MTDCPIHLLLPLVISARDNVATALELLEAGRAIAVDGITLTILRRIPRGHKVALRAIRAGDPKLLTCDVFEGHLSSALPHLGNISYRVGHALIFDGKAEKFVDDKQADRLLTREYRKGFEIPSAFNTSTQEAAKK